jgi:tRNA(Ile)-lysidine synthase
MNLPESFVAHLQSGCLPEGDGAPTLLAVSGGVDSVVMAHLFRRADLPFGIAHCNFRLRGAESDADAAFVRDLASGWDVPFFTADFETEQYAAEHGLSIQMAARELRYAWFDRVATENGFGRVATAHNLDDSIETALLNFARGTGLNGLRGIPAASKMSTGMWLIRPLLFAERTDIETFARTENITWRDDSSNAGDDYARNFIRHRVTPLLETLNPNFLQTARRNLSRLNAAAGNLDFLLQRYFAAETAPDAALTLGLQQLRALPEPFEALRTLLKNRQFSAEQIRQIADGLDHTGLSVTSTSGWRLLVDREKIMVEPPASAGLSGLRIQPDDLMLSLPDGRRLVLMPTDKAAPLPDGTEAVTVDAGKLQYPLLLRSWQAGDVFQPFGMQGKSQKLQDFFINRKVPRFEKDRTPVLVNGDGSIIWVIGHRLDERFRVSADTQHCLKITCL